MFSTYMGLLSTGGSTGNSYGFFFSREREAAAIVLLICLK